MAVIGSLSLSSSDSSYSRKKENSDIHCSLSAFLNLTTRFLYRFLLGQSLDTLDHEDHCQNDQKNRQYSLRIRTPVRAAS